MQTMPVTPFVIQLITLAKSVIMPAMFLMFTGCVFLRILIYFTVKREEAFAIEFEKRTNHFLQEDDHKVQRSFFVVTKRLLEKTFYEMFEIRSVMKRRKMDYVLTPGDRIFLIQQGSAYLVRDTLREIKYLKFEETPPVEDISKTVFGSNPCFTRIFGIIPVAPFNDMLNIIPGLFIVAGIFGTFLGIMQALPELGSMDIRDPESTKLVMDMFLAKIAFSMSTSTVGILLSVTTTVFNNFVSPERLFVRIIHRYQRTLYRLWSRSDSNALPEHIQNFDEHRDPKEALAELAVQKELRSEVIPRPMDPLPPPAMIPPSAMAPPAAPPQTGDPRKSA